MHVLHGDAHPLVVLLVVVLVLVFVGLEVVEVLVVVSGSAGVGGGDGGDSDDHPAHLDGGARLEVRLLGQQGGQDMTGFQD